MQYSNIFISVNVLAPAMITLAIVVFNIDRKKYGISMKDANKFYRKLYGYMDNSYFGRYKRFRTGFIHEIKGMRIAKSAVIIPQDNLTQLIEYLQKYHADPILVIKNLYMEENEYEKYRQNDLIK